MKSQVFIVYKKVKYDVSQTRKFSSKTSLYPPQKVSISEKIGQLVIESFLTQVKCIARIILCSAYFKYTTETAAS